MQIQSMMQKDITSVRGELSCLELAKILDDKRISGVPVVSADGALIGVVSKTDLLRKYIELSEANDSGATLADFKVHEIMSPDSLTVEPGEDLEGELRLELPSRILTTQRRAWFRVPLIGEHGLKVQVATKDQRSWPVTPIDIGMGGILIRFPKGEDPELEIGTEVTVEMRLSTDTVRLAGSVRHRRGGRYGLFFPETLVGGEIVPSPALQTIATVVERHWLVNRLS